MRVSSEGRSLRAAVPFLCWLGLLGLFASFIPLSNLGIFHVVGGLTVGMEKESDGVECQHDQRSCASRQTFQPISSGAMLAHPGQNSDGKHE